MGERSPSENRWSRSDWWGVVLDAPDVAVLTRFYSELRGWPMRGHCMAYARLACMTEGEPQLVPELAVLDLTASLRFWRDLVGFDVSYTRIEEGFAYLVLGRAHLMLDQIGVGRTWRTGELDVPLGRGVNLQIGVPSLEEPLQRLAAARWSLFLEPEEKWYRTGKQEAGVVQFLVQDPDGYLLRLQSSIGTRTAPQD